MPQKRIQGAGPQDFFKIMQFSGNFKGQSPILSKFWAQPPVGVKTPLGPPDQNPGSASVPPIEPDLVPGGGAPPNHWLSGVASPDKLLNCWKAHRSAPPPPSIIPLLPVPAVYFLSLFQPKHQPFWMHQADTTKYRSGTVSHSSAQCLVPLNLWSVGWKTTNWFRGSNLKSQLRGICSWWWVASKALVMVLHMGNSWR